MLLLLVLDGTESAVERTDEAEALVGRLVCAAGRKGDEGGLEADEVEDRKRNMMRVPPKGEARVQIQKARVMQLVAMQLTATGLRSTANRPAAAVESR